MHEAVKALIDRQQIVDLGLRYAAALDGRDFKTLRDCFTPDAVWSNPLASRTGGDAIEAAASALAALDATHHVTTNQVVTIDGDTATMRSYFTASHMRYGQPDGACYQLGGVYDDVLVRGEHGWRIAKRTLSFLWEQGNPKVMGNLAMPIGPTAAKR